MAAMLVKVSIVVGNMTSYLGFFDYLYPKQVVLQWINHDHHICKLGVHDAVPVVAIML